jgi:hypothetical protein
MPKITDSARDLLNRNASLPNGHRPQPKAETPPTPTTPPAKREAPPTPAATPELATKVDLLGAIRRDLEAVGIVGESDNALLAYIAFTSRLLECPLSIITRGLTGTGKSTLLNRVALLFPRECILDAMTLTQASIYNGPDDFLRHRVILSGERMHSTDDQTKDATAVFRQLISEGKVTRTKSIPGKNPDGGNWITQHQVRQGPIVWAESTTAGTIFEEDLNRMLQLYMDDSEQQNREVMVATGRRYDPASVDADLEQVKVRHHAFQACLQTHRVVIPYWEKIARGLPAKTTRSRRLVQQVFSVVEATTLLHQHSRQRDANNRLIATLDDYATTRALLLGPLHAALQSDDHYKIVLQLRPKLAAPTFTIDDVRVALGSGPSNRQTATRLVDKLLELHFVDKVAKAKGSKAALYQWCEAADSVILPTVDDVAKP